MAYKLLVEVFLDGKIQPANSVVEIEDKELAARLLERGSIESTDEKTPVVEAKGAAVDSAAPLANPPVEESTSVEVEQQVQPEPTPEVSNPAVPENPKTPEGVSADQILQDLEAAESSSATDSSNNDLRIN